MRFITRALVALTLAGPAFAQDPAVTTSTQEMSLADALRLADSAHKRLDAIGDPNASLARRLRELEQAHEELKSAYEALEVRVTANEGEIASLKEIVEDIQRQLREAAGTHPSLDARLDEIERVLGEHGRTLDNHEERLGDAEDDIDDLETDRDTAREERTAIRERVTFAGFHLGGGLDLHGPVGTVAPSPVSSLIGGGALYGGEGNSSGWTGSVGAYSLSPKGYQLDGQMALYWRAGAMAHGVSFGGAFQAYQVGQQGVQPLDHLGSFSGGTVGYYGRLTLADSPGSALDLLIEPRFRAGLAGTYNGSATGFTGGGELLLRLQFRAKWTD